MIQFKIYRFIKSVNLSFLLLCFVSIQTVAASSGNQQPGQDESENQENIPGEVSGELPYPFEDEKPYSYSLPENDTGLTLSRPSNLKSSVEFDEESNEYIIRDKIGDMDYRPSRSLSVDEYKDERFERTRQQFFHDRARGKSSTGSSELIPQIHIGSKIFNKIFGTNTIDIEPQGQAQLIFGINIDKTDNPNIQENLRTTTTFDFQEKIQMSVTGKIGDKVELGINYDTEATFDFENKTELGYKGGEDEIIQEIGVGNITLPIQNSLITGSQNLFGLKTKMKFGHLTVTSVFSQKKGKSKTITVEGGAQKREFLVRADEYDENRHFFLSHFFRDNYNKSLESLPIVKSYINITDIEVWVTNRQNDFDDARDIVAFVDLAEHDPDNISNSYFEPSGNQSIPYNNANNLYEDMLTQGLRDTANNIDDIILGINELSNDDYASRDNARKLSPRDYTLNSQLGFISLNSTLSPDDILAVAFEFTYRGKTYKVGNLTKDINSNEKRLVLKLLKPFSTSPSSPTWDLMMKNVYSLNAYQVEKEDFIFRVLYENPKSGMPVNYIPEKEVSDSILINVMNLDNADSHLDPYPDGMFDFIPNVTIIPDKGKVIFPVLEPFGRHMERYLSRNLNSSDEINKYVFKELYDSSKVIARQNAEKNRFIMKGSYKSSTGSEIPLNALNIPEGSVKVTAGGLPLKEGRDYTVDYQIGRVKILKQGLLESGKPINISLESNALYNMQTKTLIGTDMTYRVSDKFYLGATLLNLTERPLTKKVDFGNDPISNTMYGFNGSYTTESQFLTSLVDKIPFIDAKTPSTITVTGEFAHLIPGHSRAIEKEGNAYIDDFEASESSIDIRTVHNWVLASTPQGKFPEADSTNNLVYNYNRAKIAWYYIDPLFLRNKSLTPEYMRKNPDYQCSHYVREIYQTEIFPNRETPSGMPTNIPVMNISYYPGQKGPYNYDAAGSNVSDGINENGNLINPSSRWGGIMRDLSYSDFEEANIQYIDFWLMDPFVENKDADGGQLIFNLGEISEDILKDGKKMFEHKLPEFDETTGVEYSVWGRIPTGDSYVRSFDNGEDRPHQDVGLDGLDNEHERTFFNDYLDEIASTFPGGKNSKAYKQAQQDPSNDDYMYFRSTQYDNQKADIIQRYKRYNGLEGNSPTEEQSPESYRTLATSLPDVEDINEDNTLKKGQEAYFEYKLNITPDSLRAGMNYIMDSVSTTGKGEECDNNTPVTWYHFRIPIKEYNKRVGPISDFRSIRYARMYFTGFEDSVVFRFATLELVRSEWRKFNETLISPGEELSVPESPETKFAIGAVNIEENDNKEPVNYVLPPGITRVVDPADPQLRQLNEQAISFTVEELQDGHARAAYKTAQLDIREYKRLQMFVHAAEIPGRNALEDGDVTAFIRIGSDFTENYYEYEIPLEITEPGNYKSGDEDERDRKLVWKNEFDIKLNQLPDLKLRRNDEMNSGTGIDYNTLYSEYIENNKLSIKGNPNLNDIKTIMIGVRNPRDQGNTGEPIAVEVWMNELRLSHFKEEGGWAANARVNTTLSDFANIDVAGSTLKPGFGSIEKKTNERSKVEIYRADLSSNIALGKFFPQKAGVRLPMYIGYSTSITTPQYNPLEPDVKFKKSLDRLESDSARKALKHMVQEREFRKSINFTNVGINPSKGKQRIYSPSNFAFHLGYSKRFSRNIDIDSLVEKRIKGGFVYNYSLRPKNVYPFRKVIKGKALRLIRDFNFNYLPSLISWRSDFNAMYREQRFRNLSFSDSEFKLPWTVEKNYIWQNNYKLKFDLARSLQLDWSAGDRLRMDDPSKNGILRYEAPDNKYDNMTNEIVDNAFGNSVLQYQHKLGITYKIPINKIGLLDWTSATANYDGTYRWSAGPDYSNVEGIDNLGNTIDNSRNIRLSTRFQLTRLYNKVGFLERINKNDKRQKKEDIKTVEYKENINLRKGKSKSIYHKLGTEDVKVWVTDASGNEVKGELEIVNNNRVKFIPDETKNNATVQVEGKVAKNPNPLVVIGKQIIRTMMGVRDFSVSYSKGNATTIPGYKKEANLFRFGLDDSFNSPGVPFILGNTDEEWLGDNINTDSWHTGDSNIINPVLFSDTKRLNVRSTFEPFDGFKIELSGNWTQSFNRETYFTYNDSMKRYPEFDNAAYTETGSFSMSYIAIGTAFEQVNDSNNYHSQAFEDFRNNRKDISRRLADRRMRWDTAYNPEGHVYLPESDDSVNYKGYANGYGPYAQQNLISSFLAAYGIRGVNKIPLEALQSWQYMLPNWRVRFSKLSKIDWIKERFKSVSLNHSYNCSYSTGSFISNTEYDSARQTINTQGDYISKYNFSGVSISEQFRPLVGIDVTFKNDLRVGAKWQKSRSMSLSLASNRLTEIRSNEFSVGASYRFDEVPLILNFGNGDQKSFKSDLKLNADVGVRSNLNIYRDMEGGEPEVSQGREIVTSKLSVDYAVSSNFTLTVFYNRQSTNPFISRLYATKNTSIGFSVRFILAQ